MAAEMAGWGKFTQLMAYHIFGDIDGYMPPTIVNGDRVTNHLWKNGAGPAPGANDFLFALGIHDFDLFQKFGLNEWPFLQRS
jgi:hypothetical protein